MYACVMPKKDPDLLKNVGKRGEMLVGSMKSFTGDMLDILSGKPYVLVTMDVWIMASHLPF